MMYACLDLRFEIASACAAVQRAFDGLYAACVVADDISSPVTFDIALEGDKYALDVDHTRVLVTDDPDEVLVAAAREIDVATVAATQRSALLLHASAIAGDGGVVLITGPSGAGKSTSAAALTCAGYRYVGDEVIGVSLDSSDAIANPKPLKLDGRARRALTSYFPGSDVRVDRELEVLVSAGNIGTCVPPGSVAPVMLVVEAEYRDGPRTTSQALSKADVAELLADQCFNFAQWGRRALDRVAAIARECEGIRIEIGDTASAVEEIARIIA